MTVKIFLMGGVGNQLFQINRALSIKLEGKQVEVIYLGKIKKLVHFMINHTNHQNWIDIKKICNHLNINIRQTKTFDLMILAFFFILKKFKLYKYFDIPLDQQILIDNEYDIGYFQEKFHFKKECLNLIASSLVKQLNLKAKSKIKKNIVGFHIRGGDFMNFKNNIQIDKKPNFKLINHYLKKYKKEKKSAFIVTNDKNLLLSNIKVNQSIIYASNESNDFRKLIQCNEMFVSQSTFCFWAYLVSRSINNCIVINRKNWQFKSLI